MVNTVGLQ